MLGTRNSLDALVTALTRVEFETHPLDSVAALLQASTIENKDLREFVKFDPSRYTRNLVFRTADFELLVLCWSPGSQSPVHDHGGMRCYMTVLSGSLTVEDFVIMGGGRRQGYAKTALVRSTDMLRGSVDVRTSNRDLHRVTAGHEAAISLHVYAKPLDRFMVFSPEERLCRMAFGRYDSMPTQPQQRWDAAASKT